VAGDIAGCSFRSDSATARLIADQEGIVMTAGDNVYDRGTLATYRDCYGPTWGRFLQRTYPVPGNHDYATVGAADYFTYFGRRAGPRGRGYYAFTAGSWRVYALDSDCEAGGGCREGTAQHRWLKADLAAHPTACSMAVMHHPTFSSGPHANHVDTMPLVRVLYRAGVEIIVNGHDHIYERFAPARPWGQIDIQHGIRQFIVGTGGAGLYPFRAGRPPHSQRRQNREHGVLRLELGTEAYAWRFLPVPPGTFSDQGAGTCHEPSSSADAASPGRGADGAS
jgi:hypothetical protein